MPMAPAFNAGFALSLSLIMALGAQNAHVIRMGLQGQHVLLTVAVCVVSDVLLIAIGVFGLAQLGGLSPVLKTGLVLGGIVFLVVYGRQAFMRFWAGQATVNALNLGASVGAMSRAQATLAALAFAWLNPHAWLDTAVLIGSASLAWGQPGHAAFGAGAATGSAVWFALLGVSVFWLGQRLNSPAIWRALDGLVALMMWGTAAVLAWGLIHGPA
ncbi:lysine transporter LysE [Rhodoferax aquaticus]|uniref:Lysine transporter LysE n=2 Tax=Rhodoferax aquaticus TaxID=2527691 RepID=A0A515EVJ7_9BURK|nr:lysine transporter LysE [Rhodoferax aquaticus]